MNATSLNDHLLKLALFCPAPPVLPCPALPCPALPCPALPKYPAFIDVSLVRCAQAQQLYGQSFMCVSMTPAHLDLLAQAVGVSKPLLNTPGLLCIVDLSNLNATTLCQGCPWGWPHEAPGLAQEVPQAPGVFTLLATCKYGHAIFKLSILNNCVSVPFCNGTRSSLCMHMQGVEFRISPLPELECKFCSTHVMHHQQCQTDTPSDTASHIPQA